LDTLIVMIQQQIAILARDSYEPLRAAEELSPEERAALPERVLHFIEKLEGEIEELETQNHRAQDRLRKANWQTGRAERPRAAHVTSQLSCTGVKNSPTLD
jgi:hypothetical protein